MTVVSSKASLRTVTRSCHCPVKPKDAVTARYLPGPIPARATATTATSIVTDIRSARILGSRGPSSWAPAGNPEFVPGRYQAPGSPLLPSADAWPAAETAEPTSAIAAEPTLAAEGEP